MSRVAAARWVLPGGPVAGPVGAMQGPGGRRQPRREPEASARVTDSDYTPLTCMSPTAMV